MRAVVEENEIRQFVNTPRWNFARGHIHMANITAHAGREAGPVARLRLGVARNAPQLQRRVPLMTKRALHAGVERYRKR